MSKKQSKEKRPAPVQASIGKTFNVIEYSERPVFILGFFVLLFLLLLILYQSLVFQGMEVGGSDAVSNVARTKQLQDWEKKIGHYPLWDPYMFAGSPTYFRAAPQAWSFDTILHKLDFIFDWRIWYFLAGAVGVFLLIKFLGLPALAAMLASLAFVLMPHFQALVIVGHYSKFYALMWMPYVVVTFLYVLRRPGLLSLLLFTLALSLQIRTQHYQIIFYTLLILLFMGIPMLLDFIRKKQLKVIFRVAMLLVSALIFSFLIVAQQILSIKEYTPYSTRGGNAVSIYENETGQQDRKGVGFDYATNWSYSISEWWNLIVPKFHGGTSNELYTGNEVPQWKNRELPTYWGSMPFTQSYEYMGILLVFLALIGIIFQWNKWEVKSLSLLTLFAMILSLGKNFPVLYKAFFYYVPYFDKFRAPVMILTLVMFTTALLAAYGLTFILAADLKRKEILNRLYLLCAFFIVLLVIPLLLGSSFSLMQEGDAKRYGQGVLNSLRQVRLEMLKESVLISLMLILLGCVGIWAIIKKWIPREYVVIGFIVLIALDVFLLNRHYLQGKFVDPAVIEQQYRPGEIDRRIKEDPEYFRVFPVGQLFGDVHWVANHQSVGGYSPAKLQVIQDMVDNCLYVKIEEPIPINWNVVNFLNAKYLITNQRLPETRLQQFLFLNDQNLFAYKNPTVLPRAFFVEEYQVIPDGKERLRFVNDPSFNPGRTAILEEALGETIAKPDSATIEITRYEPERIDMQVYTDRTALLVLSEVYYPKGWRAYLDDSQEIKIYKTNHLLRSLVIPAGQHKVKLVFHPSAYYAGVKISNISLYTIYLLILIILFMHYRQVISTFTKWFSKRRA